MPKFATTRIKEEWNNSKLTAKLKKIVLEAEEYAKTKWKWSFTLTSIYRTPEEDLNLGGSGIHVEWRAVDVRTKDQSQEAINDVAKYINSKWVYDSKRPNLKVCFTDVHGTGPHAHFQVHTNTKLRS